MTDPILTTTAPPAPMERNPAAVDLAGLAPTGRAAMLSKLRRVAAILGGDDPLQMP